MATETVEQDHVDRFLASIAASLPELDLEVEGIVDRIGGINRRLQRALDETLAERLAAALIHALPRNVLHGPSGPGATSCLSAEGARFSREYGRERRGGGS